MDYFRPDPKPEKKIKVPYAGIKKTPIKFKPKGNTEQLDFMIEVFNERGAKCEITGELLEFSPMCCHHLLSKKTYGRFKLYKPNLIIILPEIHYLYHNSSKEYVLDMHPGAKILYDRLEELRIEYNQPEKTT